MIKIILVLLSLSLLACEAQEKRQKEYEADQHQKWIWEQDISNKKIIVEDFSYYKDPRTGLCFFGRGLDYRSAVLTNVPCTPEVEKIIK